MKDVKVSSYSRLNPTLEGSRNLAKRLLSYKLSSKPYDLDDIKTINFEKISDEEREFINSLEEYTLWDLYESDKTYIGGYFRPNLKLPQWFVLVVGNTRILVDTEGYDYIRYAVKIISSGE